MSYDLFFWNQSEECSVLPLDACELLSNDGDFEGLIELESDEIKKEVFAKYPPREEQEGTSWHEFSDGSSFEFYCNHKLVRVLSKGVAADILNDLIIINSTANATLYDPQNDTRYDGISRDKPKGRYFRSKPKEAIKLKDDWIKCPGYGFRLQTTNKSVWHGDRHVRCGQKIITNKNA